MNRLYVIASATFSAAVWWLATSLELVGDVAAGIAVFVGFVGSIVAGHVWEAQR
jgi:hypothetical protein